MNQYPLPEGWRWARISEVCEKPEYGFTASAEYKPIGPKLLRISDIQYGVVNWDDVPYCRCESNFDRYLLKPGDILFARTGGTTGKSYLIKDVPAKSIFASYLIRLKTKENLFPEYLYLFLQSDLYWKQVDANKRGGAQPNLNATLLSNLVFPFPPLPEQRRIAEKIQEIMQDVDRARAACEKQLEAAQTLASAYLREVFESEESKTLEKRKLRDVCEVKKTPVFPDSLDAKRLPYVGLEHIESGTGKILAQISDHYGKLIQSITFRFDERHILYGKLRPYLNKVATPDFEGRCTTESLPIIPKAGIDRHYLAWLFRRKETIEEAMRQKTGSRMPRANIDVLFKLIVPIPSFLEQCRISAYLNNKMEYVETLLKEIQSQKSYLNNLPQAILQRAFKGET